MQELSDDKTCRAQSRIAAGDRGGHNTKKSQNAAKSSQPALTDGGNHLGSLKRERCAKFLSGASVEEIHRYGSPYQGNDTLGNHRSVEHRATQALTLHATRHQRCLCSVETTYGATGDSDEKGWENGRLEPFAVNSVGKFGKRWPLNEEHHHESQRHENHGNGKQRVYLAYNLIDREHRGDDVINEDYAAPDVNPGETFATDIAKNQSRRINKNGSNHHQQEDTKDKHHALGALTEIMSYEFWLPRTIVAHRKHSREIVVNGSGKDTSEHNPQIGRRAELRSHDGSEDRSGAGDVQKLNHEYLPAGKHNEVDSVVYPYGRSLAVVGRENLLNQLSIEHIAKHKC